MALTNMDKRRPSLVSKGGELKKNGWEKERRRGRGREEEEKRKGKPSQKGMETEFKYGIVWKLTLIMDSMRFGMDHMEFV